tara:strand:- start:66 stop:353 length:288 start_codon:yes stop_codon:yes gene_type:complete
MITLPIACEVLSLYNRDTLIANKKAGYAEGGTSTQPYPNAEQAAKGMREFYQTFALNVGFFVSSKGGAECLKEQYCTPEYPLKTEISLCQSCQTS